MKSISESHSSQFSRMAHSNLELADTELLVESIQRKRIPPVKLQEALLEIVQNHASVARLFADKLLMDTKDETVSVDPEDSDASAKQSDSEEQDDEADDDRFKGMYTVPFVKSCLLVENSRVFESFSYTHNTAGIKRKTESRDNANRGRTLMWKTCMNCEEVYNKNWEGACQFHPGRQYFSEAVLNCHSPDANTANNEGKTNAFNFYRRERIGR